MNRQLPSIFSPLSVASPALAAAALVAALGLATQVARADDAAQVSAPARASGAAIERGRYLVTTSGCHDCHTPWRVGPQGPEPDMSRALSGHPQDLVMPPAPRLPDGPWIASIGATNTAWSGPWGTSFTANLTPDRETGLGRWTLENFREAIRTGRHMGRGRPILPPMPYPMYKHMTDEDLAAIFAYLQSIPAIRNQVPDPLPPAQQVASAQ
ncbi:MAG: cytochrome c [Steroidobacteraceae bacterium]|jgi:mono/diheme cytochrome c family protein|nr:cytochrome c [Steroidobacteraceae bacterium]